jgi:hypothetical protein
MSSHEIEAQGDHPSLSIGVAADFGWAEFELLRRWSAGTVMTPKVMRRRRTQRPEKKEREHKATTGDSDNSTFDSFDGVGVVDVVSNSNAMYKGLDVLARGSLTTADGNI